jgi:hypothetical protein
MPTPLFSIPNELEAPAADAAKLYGAKKYSECVILCQERLAALEKELPSRYIKSPRDAATGSVVYQYYTLTLIATNALAELNDWKAAKEALGKYRVHFPRDPWGFRAGAEVTRRDPDVKDRAAVTRAIELLEGEAKRLEGK